MSQQLRQLKGRIRSVEGTWKVTRAMEMVAMSRFKTLESPLEMSRVYLKKLATIAFDLIRAKGGDLSHPFLKKSSSGPIGLLVVTGEAGLCGVYNDQVLKAADVFATEHQQRGIKIYAFGRKAANYYRKKRVPVFKVFSGFHERLKPDFHAEIYRFLEQEFLGGSVGEVYVAYTVFKNAIRHYNVVQKILNIEVPPGENSDFIIEAGDQGTLSQVASIYASNRFRLMLMESFISEHSARMVSMKAAKDNAKELMGDLVLLRNKIRQAVITKEIIEIVSSSEALKG